MAEGDRKQSDIHAPRGAWKLLGELLEGRRRELGYRYRTEFERDRGMNKRLTADIEKAYASRINTFPTGTLRRIAQVYEVTYESMLAVLMGRADALVAVTLAVPLTAGPGDPPMTDPGRRAADAPYADVIWQRLLRLAAQGNPDPSGAQLFPGSPQDAQAWDGIGARFDLSDRVWLLADLQRRAAGRAAHGNPGLAYVTAG